MYEFRARDFIGGHPAIDFVNTVTARNAVPVDRLDDYAAVTRWAALSSLSLRLEPVYGPEADAELRRCKALREALHATLTAVIDTHPVPSPAAVRLQTQWRHATAHAELDLSVHPFTVRFDQHGPVVSLPRRRLAAAAVELLTDLSRERLHRCPGERCGWLFLDASKAGRRRWCDMATCGTYDKNRRRRT